MQAEGTQNVNILDERDWLIYGWSVLNKQVSGVKWGWRGKQGPTMQNLVSYVYDILLKALPSSLTLGKSLNLPEPLFSDLYMGVIKPPL